MRNILSDVILPIIMELILVHVEDSCKARLSPMKFIWNLTPMVLLLDSPLPPTTWCELISISLRT